MHLAMALLSLISTAVCRVGGLRPAVARVSATFPRVPLRRAAASCSAADEVRQKELLIASLQQGLGSWNDFDSPRKEQKKPLSKNAAKQTTKRSGKDGKLYLRDGPKRPVVATKLAKRRMSSDAAPSDASSPADVKCRVRIEESGKGGKGKKATVIRGLGPLSSERVATILKDLKTALSVGGRVNGDGELEIQGAHAEACLLRLQKAGFRDVRLAGGAGSKKTTLAWNAPREVRERAEAAKHAAKVAKRASTAAEKAAANSPAAIAAKKMKQLRESEAQHLSKLKRSDVPKAEKQQIADKLARIQQRIADAS